MKISQITKILAELGFKFLRSATYGDRNFKLRHLYEFRTAQYYFEVFEDKEGNMVVCQNHERKKVKITSKEEVMSQAIEFIIGFGRNCGIGDYSKRLTEELGKKKTAEFNIENLILRGC